MRALLALIAVAVVACDGVDPEPPDELEPLVPCETSDDCIDGTICGTESERANSAKPSAPGVGYRSAFCYPPCTRELHSRCALPACPERGARVRDPFRWTEGGNLPDDWDESTGTIRASCGGFDAALHLTCDFRSGVLVVTGAYETIRPYPDAVDCEYLRPMLEDGRWPWSF